MSKLLKDDVGFSGHGVTIAGSAGAVALGAMAVEKHVTLNKNARIRSCSLSRI